jgi:hypothetical protein
MNLNGYIIILLLCTLLNFCSPLFHGALVERMYCIIGYVDVLKSGVGPTFSCRHGYCAVFPSFEIAACMNRSLFPHGVESLRSKQPLISANSTYLKVYWLVHKTLQQVSILIQISSLHSQLQLGPLGCHFWPAHFPCVLLALPISFSFIGPLP